MRRVEQLITQVRRQTENEDAPADGEAQGLSDEEFVQYLNDAQTRIQNRVLSEVPDIRMFDAAVTASIAGGTRSYNISTTTASPVLGNMVHQVEYRAGSLEDDYYTLSRTTLSDMSLVSADYPTSYDVRDGAVLISPIPSSSLGNLRITFPKRLNSLDKRRGKITSAGTSGSSYSTITLAETPSPDSILKDEDFYICVNDKNGVVGYYNVPVVSYNSSTRILTLDSGVSVSAGSITAGSYVTYGQWTTTHSSLPNEFERYLLAYCAWKIFKRDGDDEASLQEQEVLAIENDLIQSLQHLNRGTQELIVMNDFYML